MHAYSILLIGAWVLGSGVVAYVCDNLGRKLGKRRLSLWGLRPRHTAMVVTVLTGVCIAAVTVGMVALVSVDARQALFQVISLSQQAQTLKEQQESLTLQNRRLQRYTRKLTAKATDAETEARKRSNELTRVKRDLSSAQNRLALLNRSRERLIRQVSERQTRLAQLSAQLAAFSGRLQASERNLALSRRHLAASGRRLSFLNRQLALKKGQVTSLTAQSVFTRLGLQAAENDLKDAQSAVEHQKSLIQSQESQITSNKQQLSDLNDQLQDLNSQLQGTQAALSDDEKQLDDVQKRLNDANRSNVIFQTNSILFTTGQEIARRVIYQHDGAAEVRRELDKLLKSADDLARSKGASGISLLPLLPGGWVSTDGEKSDQVEEKIRTVLSQRIAADGKDVLIQALVSANFVPEESGEPQAVQVLLVVSPNQLVFHHGEQIASRTIDGHLSEAKVLEELLGLLQNQVRGKALSAGLIPPPSGVVGEINWEMILNTVGQLRRHRRPMVVRVITQADAWTADPLLIRLVLRS